MRRLNLTPVRKATAFGIYLDDTDNRRDPRIGYRVQMEYYKVPRASSEAADYYQIDKNFTAYIPFGGLKHVVVLNYFESDSGVLSKGSVDRNAYRCPLEAPPACQQNLDEVFALSAGRSRKRTRNRTRRRQRLRGYPAYRFVDNYTRFYGAEYRWYIHETNVEFERYLQKGVFLGSQLAAFYEVGTVAATRAELDTNRYRYSYGVGYRAVWVLWLSVWITVSVTKAAPPHSHRLPLLKKSGLRFRRTVRQKHLYKMWQAVDAVLWAFRSKNSVVAQNGGTAVDQDYLNQATLITHDYSDGTYAATAYAVVATIYTAAAATYAFTDGAYADSGDSTIASAYAVDAAIYVADACLRFHLYRYWNRIDLRPHILQDIADVEKLQSLTTCTTHAPDEYGKIWQSFAEALTKKTADTGRLFPDVI
ncbi:hypothetical protein CHS0354_006854 [Potamilus streckersoni]|uniref:Uncharacterized protein n=1 Tax=Potamilus streckersoni TaxID=2493646 RepID=A0AAE0TFM0_9BIVA|nr:hypothetical protein CHS0354_006854 [Potamilus streckersoni]